MERLRLIRQRSLVRVRRRAVARLRARYRALLRAGRDIWMAIFFSLLTTVISLATNVFNKDDGWALCVILTIFASDYMLLRGISVGESRPSQPSGYVD